MRNKIRTGDYVRMTKAFKNEMNRSGSGAHIREFGKCTGIVLGLLDYGTQLGPELDVRWLPSNLVYGYHPTQLRLVNTKESNMRRAIT